MEDRNLGHGVIEKVLLYDDHRSSDKNTAISVTTLLGSNWKAQRDMLKDLKQRADVNPMNRRSSTIGTGFHLRAEEALKLDPMANAQEVYSEREINGVWISGSFDLVYDGHIMDFKTSYGKSFSEDKIEKARFQMSIYRWLNPDIYIADIAYVLFISQSNNAYDSYMVQLLDEQDTERFILSRLEDIKKQNRIDCMDNVKYDPCSFCNYSKSDCEKLYKNNSGGFE